ncbi:helix-turn-helix domain-containing protein [Chitinibacter sp. SCUT-21]|uniref:helix-turn-helix domain-containing protein n=1 Tax=Chitinibacter sp. SCUT-21 TaxID=2970891 RepID=UPI0035A69C86
MLRFRVKELMAEKEFQEDRRITLVEVAESCGINRMTLSKIAGQKGYSTVTDNIDKLCAYFGCEVGELIVYVPTTDEDHKD